MVSQTHIATKYDCNHSTVSRLKKKYDETNSIQNKKSTGRKKTFTEQNVLDMKNIFLQHGCVTVDDIRKKYEEFYPQRYTNSTVRRMLKTGGLDYKRKTKKHYLDSASAKKRLDFAKKYKDHTMDFWKLVVFTDETIIKHGELVEKKGWRPNTDTNYAVNSVIPSKQGGGFKVTLWSCITYYGPGYIVNLPEGLDSETYLKILREDLNTTIDDYPPLHGVQLIVAQDNSPVHNARIIQNFFYKNANFKLLPWPAYSPDLNVIENAWAFLKKQLYDIKDSIKTKEQLFEVTKNKWYSLDHKYCKSIYESIPKRLNDVIKSQGFWTKY